MRTFIFCKVGQGFRPTPSTKLSPSRPVFLRDELKLAGIPVFHPYPVENSYPINVFILFWVYLVIDRKCVFTFTVAKLFLIKSELKIK